jgi:pimeloyl-ACP methyl ester carboxylesterase
MSDAALVYVHGLWMTGVESLLLRRRLQRDHGYRVHLFHYPSVHAPMAVHTASLHRALSSIDAPNLHLVGHSLGGLVILRYLERFALMRPGRVVFVGTPATGSRSAQHFGRWRFGRRLMGPVIGQELLVPRQRSWRGERELGVIAGTSPRGLGNLLVKFTEDNDGMVAVSETRLPGAKEYLNVPASHSGMLVSARVAREIGNFLEHGSFTRKIER